MAEAIVTAIASEVASQTTSQVAESLTDSIKREISYVFKYKSFMNDLEDQVKELEYLRQRVERAVEHAERQGEEIFEDVKAWLIGVEHFTRSIAKPIVEDEDVGLCPNLLKRYSLGKKSVKAAEEGANLLGKRHFSQVSYCPPPERPIHKLGRGFQDFDSRVSIFQEIMELLKDSNVDMIGVYGMGGVGKTTLVKQVARQVLQDKLFDVVVMAEATQTLGIITIQDEIARDLGLEFKQRENVFLRAEQLRQRLKKVKRILVIIDNIWKNLDLDIVGILPKDDVDNQTRCTILLTSRSEDLLCIDMNSQKNIRVEVLSNKEAGQLFEKIVGYSTKTSDFQPIADEIVKRCGGLPVALNTIANALKKKSLPFWKDALNLLNNCNPREIHGMDANVYSSIKLSYNFLESNEAKSLFLLCGLYRAGDTIYVSDLLRYGKGLGFFKNVYTLEATRNRVYRLIDNLKSSCLLLDGEAEDCVKMHDIIHDVAVSIASEKLMFNIRNVADLKEEIEQTIHKDQIAISLPYCKDSQDLPERLECLQLKLLLLFTKKDSSLLIPDLFFEGMKELKVIDFTGICFSSFPSTLAYLVNLRTLCLDYCQLKDTAIVGQLKKLEILSFRGSHIMELPLEIGQLTRLQLLDLSKCSRLEMIAPNVISKLSRLEELYMGQSFTRWEKVEGGSNASLVELKGLLKLTTLDIDIPDAQTMLQDLVSVELERFSIFIGSVRGRYDKYETSRMMKLRGLEKGFLLGNYRMKMLLKRTEDLFLHDLKGVQNVVNELDDGKGFPQLKHLHVNTCSEILHIVTSVGEVHCKVFPLLESLFLRNLINLEKVCHGQLTEDQCFSNLRIIKVEECDRLKHLFSFSMAKSLLRLQKVKVTDCENLEMIVGPGTEKPTTSTSGFKDIMAEDDEKAILPSLEKLKLESIKIRQLWPDQFTKMSTSFCCRNLTKVTVRDCISLKYLFSYSMVSSLVQLQHLEIEVCESMEAIIFDTSSTGLGRHEGKLIEMVFPKLLYLHLLELPELTGFARGHIHSLELPSVRELKIWRCPHLRRFISMSSSQDNVHTEEQPQSQPLFDDKVLLPSLELLSIRNMGNLRKIWHPQLASDSFTKLKYLEIIDCRELKNIFPAMVGTLNSLVNLNVSKCEKIEEIIGLVGEEVQENRIAFSELKLLELNNLTRLTSFCLENCSLEFPTLERVSVIKCPNMKTFSHGVLLCTPKLYKVKVTEKEEDELWHWEGNLDSTIQKLFEEMVGFRDIEDLKFSDFPRFREIWHGQALNISVFSNLGRLVVDDCMNMSSAIPAKLLRCLNKLRTLVVQNCDSLEEVLHLEVLNADGDHLGPLFPRLCTLQLNHLPKLKRFSNFTGNKIELPDLKYLIIENCPNMESFVSHSTSVHMTTNKEPQERTSEENIQPLFDEKVAFPNLKSLELSRLPKVLHLWKENSESNKFCTNLEILEISECSKLQKSVPSSWYFKKLRTLEVSKCDGLKQLATLSASQSLVNLARMNVTDCKMIEEVIQLEVGEEAVNDCIVFRQLEYLGLDCLPSLTSFYPGNYTLEFPSLEQVLVKQCPKMMIFSQGVLGIPKLNKVQLTEEDDDQGCWEGNLNYTIHKLFNEMGS